MISSRTGCKYLSVWIHVSKMGSGWFSNLWLFHYKPPFEFMPLVITFVLGLTMTIYRYHHVMLLDHFPCVRPFSWKLLRLRWYFNACTDNCCCWPGMYGLVPLKCPNPVINLGVQHSNETVFYFCDMLICIPYAYVPVYIYVCLYAQELY